MPTSVNDSKDLISLCRTGKLYALEHWIACGRPLTLPPTRVQKNRSLLQIAVQTGFHSLVELIAGHESDQTIRNTALSDAVEARRLDLVELLVENGAQITSVPFADVLLTWEPRIIRFFLDHGADPISGSPFAVAFGSKARTALRPYLDHKNTHPELAQALQQQTDAALRRFASDGELKWVSLMLWVGADPRSVGPVLGDDCDSSEAQSSALKEACYSGRLDVVKKFKPKAELDSLEELLHCAAIAGNKDLIAYLLHAGADPNDKENGGSRAIDTLMWHLSIRRSYEYGHAGLRSRFAVSDTLDCIKTLLEARALWRPDSDGDLHSIRRALLECEPAATISLLQLLRTHDACTADQAERLIGTPRMRKHLADNEWHLSRLGLFKEELRAKKQVAMSRLFLQRYKREELFERVWARPMREVAKDYGVSDVWLAKVCRALRVPVPGRGYWAKVRAGLSAGKPPRLGPLPK